MNERARILRLVEEGRITPDEAGMLLEVLAEVEAPSFTPPQVSPEPPRPAPAEVAHEVSTVSPSHQSRLNRDTKSEDSI